MDEGSTTTRDRRISLTRFFVPDPAFRWFATAIALGSAGIAGFFGTLSWWYHRRIIGTLDGAQLGDPSAARQSIEFLSHSSVTIIAVAAVGTALFTTLLALFLIHRITGPAYRLRRHMLGIVMGREPTRLAFREGDQMSDLGAAYNELMGHLGLVERTAPGVASPSPDPAADARRLVARARS